MKSQVKEALDAELVRRVDVSDVVRSVLASDYWRGTSPRDINAGGCEDFQQDVIAAGKLCGATAELCTENFPEEGARLPGHCWVQHEGRHYDAEAPDGVEDWQDLPIFKRVRGSKR
jgi:hypothetical protein